MIIDTWTRELFFPVSLVLELILASMLTFQNVQLNNKHFAIRLMKKAEKDPLKRI